MKFVTDIEPDIAAEYQIGGKAKNLYRLKTIGLTVPKWVVIPQDVLTELIPLELQQANGVEFNEVIEQISIPDDFIDNITNYFTGDVYFAVRSSAIDEDGSDYSFAGQFETHLFVVKENLATAIKKVWKSSFSERVLQYRKNNKLDEKFGIAVIIQEMIPAEVAGVAFGIGPATGDRQAKMISTVYGLGEGLVSGELNSDNFILKNNTIESRITEKIYKIVIDNKEKGGTKKINVDENKINLASLSTQQIEEVFIILDACYKEFGKPQDIEFAIFDNKIFVLQSRPITSLHKLTDTGATYVLWDNSNIIESYPGVTTPLTFSFISRSYENAYKLFCEFMGVNKKIINENERVFANTLGFINGRVYYNLKTWYHMLAMLPGYSINARFMEKMMGVKEQFDIPDSYLLSKGNAWWRIMKMAVKMYGRFLSLPRKRKEFIKLLNQTINEYKNINYDEKNSNDLMQLYLKFESLLLNEWKAPLANDFFAMIWFGMLQKRCVKYKISKNPNIHNDLLCGSSDIISTQPIHRCIALATMVSKNHDFKALFINNDEYFIWQTINNNKDPQLKILKEKIDQYILDFGERCIGELKLETISYTQNPAQFIKVLKLYVETDITVNKTTGKVEEEIRSKAELELNSSLKNKLIKKWIIKKNIKKARELVSSRENLRYERTRAFGIVREIFSHIGKRWYAESILDHPSDIFFMTREEIFSYIEGTSVTQNIKSLIELRKTEYKSNLEKDPPSERFATHGIVYHANDFYSMDKIEKIEGDLKGIGCCPGHVRAKVRVVLNPDDVTSLDGDILVTSSTDPGWVTLFPGASAIIVERGSVLSHSAIVAREMGKPCIVSVTGLLKTLKTGDEIEMDGSTGEIKIIHSST